MQQDLILISESSSKEVYSQSIRFRGRIFPTSLCTVFGRLKTQITYMTHNSTLLLSMLNTYWERYMWWIHSSLYRRCDHKRFKHWTLLQNIQRNRREAVEKKFLPGHILGLNSFMVIYQIWNSFPCLELY